MLTELHIENIAVIEHADIVFREGLNMLTGETGAGKSIIIDSIGAILGDRVTRELVRHGAEKGTVTATFSLTPEVQGWLTENELETEDDLVVQRRITAEGKTTARINGMPVTAAQLKTLGSLLIDIHGQNDGRTLLDERQHLRFLDSFAALGEVKQKYQALYKAYKDIQKEIRSLSMDEIEKERMSESLRYQIEELSRADLKPGEYDSLTERRDLLRNAEKLTDALQSALAALDGGEDNATACADNAAYYTERAAAYLPDLNQTAEQIKAAAFSLADAAETIHDMLDSLDFSPEEYDELETRIAFLSKLSRKYGRAVDDLPVYLEECREKLDRIEYADDRLVKLNKDLKKQETVCLDAARKLSNQRKEAAVQLEARIVQELKDLSMPSVRFMVDFQDLEGEVPFDSTGCDAVAFEMSANAGEALGKINKIASGGELSRIMLAMKNVFAENDPVPTLIFDEIDTGVSGIAAQRVGEKLFTVSKNKQVMCVTHLPQIAAMADAHFVIAKSEHDGRTYTEVTELDFSGRKQELARLHGGEHVTELTLLSAEEQLKNAGMFKRNH